MMKIVFLTYIITAIITGILIYKDKRKENKSPVDNQEAALMGAILWPVIIIMFSREKICNWDNSDFYVDFNNEPPLTLDQEIKYNQERLLGLRRKYNKKQTYYSEKDLDKYNFIREELNNCRELKK